MTDSDNNFAEKLKMLANEYDSGETERGRQQQLQKDLKEQELYKKLEDYLLSGAAKGWRKCGIYLGEFFYELDPFDTNPRNDRVKYYIEIVKRFAEMKNIVVKIKDEKYYLSDYGRAHRIHAEFSW